MTENEWQRRITDYCDLLGLLWHHETDSRRSKEGFPDLVIVGASGTLFAELKTDTGRLTAKQREWIDRINTSRAEAWVWRPCQWPLVAARLKDLAKPF